VGVIGSFSDSGLGYESEILLELAILLFWRGQHKRSELQGLFGRVSEELDSWQIPQEHTCQK
jgi:hypothetical protein